MDVVGERRSVGEEDRIELVRFRALGQFLVIANVEHAVRRRPLIPPRRFVMAARIDEEVKVKLPAIAHV
jgi:hypothetical protein